MKKEQGFTLIELLVVIAIIGILASVVLASLNSARAKGADAAVKENLANLRPQAEIYYDNQGCYSGTQGVTCSGIGATSVDTCTNATTTNSIFVDAKFLTGITAATSASGGLLTSCSQVAKATNWAVAVQLKSNPQNAWCVDSTGNSKLESTTVTSGFTQTTLNAIATSGACS